jgi:flagellin-like hook-associated protein FlgL
MNYFKINTDSLDILIQLRDGAVKMMEESDNDYFKEKLQEDICDLNDAINRITNDVNDDVEGDS